MLQLYQDRLTFLCQYKVIYDRIYWDGNDEKVGVSYMTSFHTNTKNYKLEVTFLTFILFKKKKKKHTL